MTLKEILENIKKTIEVLGAPIVTICAIWGLDVAAIVSATATFLIALITYIEFFIDNKNKQSNI